ncbi:hypothetical protein SLS62_006437 [Diatrype stigma]|uniref:Methyltransferase n=1 Tax=Diatrype stigma TaxID=117547 RepID=A0AAN9YP30_9PEZI
MDAARSRDRAGAAAANPSTPSTPERCSIGGPTPRPTADNPAQSRSSESVADGCSGPTSLKPTSNQNHPYGHVGASASSSVWKHFGPDDSDDSASDDAPGRSLKYAAKSTNKFQSFIRKIGRSSAQKGEYLLPSNVHNQMLYLAPLVAPRRILDIGAGTGVWAIDFANQHPKSDVLGIDINPIEPEQPVPPNCRFETADVDEEWTFTRNKLYDYIHVRSLGVVINHEQLFKTIYDHLTPGGFVEFQEWNLKLDSADHSLEGTQLYKWNRIAKLGKDPSQIMKYRDMLPNAGFEDIVERKYAVPVNAWAPDKQSKAMGDMNKANLLASMPPLSMVILPRGLGNSEWSVNDVEDLLSGVRRDLDNTNIHAFMTLMTVYCQKPRRASPAPTSQPGKE